MNRRDAITGFFAALGAGVLVRSGDKEGDPAVVRQDLSAIVSCGAHDCDGIFNEGGPGCQALSACNQETCYQNFVCNVHNCHDMHSCASPGAHSCTGYHFFPPGLQASSDAMPSARRGLAELIDLEERKG